MRAARLPQEKAGVLEVAVGILVGNQQCQTWRRRQKVRPNDGSGAGGQCSGDGKKHKRLDLLVDIQAIEVRENTRVGQQW